MAEYPLVTIVTPTYNRAGYLPETLESILAQSYPNIEHIILDDGSTDDTREVVERFRPRYGARQLIYDRHENMGEARTVSKGWQMARGDFIITVNSDDVVYPAMVEKEVAVMQAHPEALVAYPDADMIDETGAYLRDLILPDYDFDKMLFWRLCLPSVGTMMRRKIIYIEGVRDPQYRYIGDYEYWLRVALHGPFVHIPEKLAAWRLHTGAATVGIPPDIFHDEHLSSLQKFYTRRDLSTEIYARRREAFAVLYYFSMERYVYTKSPRKYVYWLKTLPVFPFTYGRSHPSGYGARWWQYTGMLFSPMPYLRAGIARVKRLLFPLVKRYREARGRK